MLKEDKFTSQDNFDVLIPKMLFTTLESLSKTLQGGMFHVFLYISLAH